MSDLSNVTTESSAQVGRKELRGRAACSLSDDQQETKCRENAVNLMRATGEDQILGGSDFIWHASSAWGRDIPTALYPGYGLLVDRQARFAISVRFDPIAVLWTNSSGSWLFLQM